ncbi:MAG: adenylate/guanylate cyclase domain-containing protein [Bacteroidota bacterium]
MRIYDEADGLPNHFINGILPEGDSVLWLSTNYGLCRFSLLNEHCLNFFTADGLSSDEFNRISFFRAQNGRLYFGGLNGVNAFKPERRFLEHRRIRAEVPLLLTQISYVDGTTDSLQVIEMAELDDLERLELHHQDRLFNFTFSLTDYRHPGLNRYSYFLEGYDQGWSVESSSYRLRLTDIPPGNYTLHVRARVAKEEWLNRQLSLPIIIMQPYYYRWWFWATVLGGIVLAGFGLLRYRIYAAEKQGKELESLVRKRTAELAAEKQKSEDLLLNILPEETAKELLEFGKARARRYEQVTVFFSDFVAFTAVANALEPEELVEELDYCFRTFDQIVERYKLEKIKTIGDAYLFIGKLDVDAKTAALDCLKASRDIQIFLRNHAEESRKQGRPVFRARVGLHTGPLVTGVVGTHKFAYDIWGETVNVAARMESQGIPEGIVISESTYRLVQDEFHCQPHGTFEEHGKEVGMWVVK